MSSLTLVAVTHQRAPFTTLERVTLDGDAADAAALALRCLPGVDESVVLSTCNRTELYLTAPSTQTAAAIDVLATHTGVPASHLRDIAHVLTGDDASLHLFRVAAGLESRVIGEGEILGQVRAAAARANAHPAAGPSLSALFRWAAATGRRARRDAGGPTHPSLARTALDAAGPLARTDLTLVLGAGALAAAVTAELRARRLPYRVAARRLDRAATLTRRADDATTIDRLRELLPQAALIVCATGARTPILRPGTVIASLVQRDGRPLTIIDLSMPRNVAPDIADLVGVNLIHLEHLSGSEGDLHLRRSADAVTAEHRRYRLWLAGRAAGPLIAALHQRVTDICLAEAERELGADATAFARRLAGKVLHAPTLAIKELSARGDTAALDALAAALDVQQRPDRPADLLPAEAAS